jgi:hypothetical protein
MNNKYELLLAITKQSMESLLRTLNKAEAHVKEKGIPETELLTAKLYDDMFDFTKQVQIATDYGRKDLASLAGKEPVKMEDTETTIAQLKERVQKSLDIINTFSISDFDKADEAKITFAWMKDSYFEGKELLEKFAITNLLFHVVTAYDILRSKGVNIGKSDFIGEIKTHPFTSTQA